MASIIATFMLSLLFEYFNMDSADLITDETVATFDIKGDQ